MRWRTWIAALEVDLTLSRSSNALMGPETWIDSDLAVIVVGGYEYSPGMNQPATQTVREMARRFRVLNVMSEAHGSVLARLRGRARHLGARDVAQTVFGTTQPRRVEERLWLAPVRGLAAIAPLSFPEPIRRRNVRRLSEIMCSWLQDVDADECLLLFYWWALPELVASVPHVASIYDCTDDPAAMPGSLARAKTVARLEGQLLDAVDLSYVVSEGLLGTRSGAGRRVSVLPNGFDTHVFRKLEAQGFAVPQALRPVPRPIVGYAGGLGPRMDWELLTQLAERRPEWSFVFVGGSPHDAPEALRERSNAVFQPVLPYPDALGAMTRFDVATIPARVQAFSRGNSFMKLLDYFAHGTPVVATALPDTVRVAEAEPGLLELADGVEGWLAALERALSEPRSSDLRDARRRFVEASSIERRVDRMLADAVSTVRVRDAHLEPRSS